MKNRRTREFRKRFEKLPSDVQEQAKASYRLFKKNPFYPSLHFECIDREESLWSTRIGLHYRAVGIKDEDTIHWFFIGSHEDYNRLL